MKKYTQKLIIALILAVIAVSCVIAPTVALAIEFPDMQGHWAESYVNALAATGAIKGFEDGLFHPSEYVTTQEFITILIRNEYGEMEAPDDDWSLPYMAAALQKGVIEEADISSSDQPMDRLSAVRFTHFFLSNIKEEPDTQHVSVAEQLTDYSYCRECRVHLEQCYAKGIVIGKPGPTFDGDANLTRAEASIVIMKALNPSMRTPPLAYQDEEGLLITGETAVNILNNNNAILVDVRTQEEYDKQHIPGSVLVPVVDIINPEIEKPFDEEMYIIVYCSAGSRSRQAYNYLVEQGYKHVYNMGIIDNWPYVIDDSNS
ncbi:MAG: S-layer homology domain-containing protein [Oscillospiraceae bacterium]|nr:S-layer homology domain-containing protein [Oscillospiraceae bacterium]